MDAELVDLASSRPEILMRFLDSQGVESFSDLRGIWGSSMEFVSEIESFAGQALPADEAMGLATFWALASKRAHDGHRRLVDALVSERSSSYRSSVRLQEAPQEPPTSSSRVRRLIADGTSGPSPMVVLTATTDAHAKEQAQKQTKLDVMFELALNYVVKLEDLGVTWQSLEDPMILQATKDTVMAGASRLGVGRLPWCLHFADGRVSPATMDLISEIQPLCSWRLFSRVWQKGPNRSGISVPGFAMVAQDPWRTVPHGPLVGGSLATSCW